MPIEIEDGKGVLFSNDSEAFNGRIKIGGKETSIVGTLRDHPKWGLILAMSVEAGALFPKENENPRAPNYGGVIRIDGEEVKISGWLKQTPKGRLFSLAHNTYGDKPAENYPKEVKRTRDDDDLPF